MSKNAPLRNNAMCVKEVNENLKYTLKIQNLYTMTSVLRYCNSIIVL